MEDDKHCDLNLDLLTSLAGSLESAAAWYHGPQCCQTLMTTETGKVAVTGDGMTILDALHFSHPLARMIKEAINSCHSYTKDGSKTFLILTSAILKSLRSFINQSRSSNNLSRGINRQQYERQSMIIFGRNLSAFMIDILPKFYQKLITHCLQIEEGLSQDLLATLKSVVRTSLSPHFGTVMCKFFTDILVESLPQYNTDESTRSEVVDFLSETVKWYNILCVKVANRPYSETRVYKPFLLNRDFAVKCDGMPTENIKAFLLCGAVGQVSNENGTEIFHVREISKLDVSLTLRQQRTQMFAERCRKKGVHLLISTEGVPQFALDVFKQCKISVIHHVLEEDIEFLSFLCGKLPLASSSDLMTDENVFFFTNCISVVITGQKYTHVQPAAATHQLWHLLVCGPTKGLCDNLGYILRKSVTSMLNCFDLKELTSYVSCDTSDINKDFESNPKDVVQTPCSCLVVPGGGAFEILMSQLLTEEAEDTNSVEMSSVCHTLADAFMAVPRSLFRNTSDRINKSSRNFVIVEKLLRETSKTEKPMGVSRRGEITDMLAAGVIEPVSSKLHLVQCVLDLIAQLVRIDRIVSVKSKE